MVFSFLGSICVSGFATPVVNCGTARVPMGLPMDLEACRKQLEGNEAVCRELSIRVMTGLFRAR